MRENATLWDVLRYKEWHNAKAAGNKVAQQRQRAAQAQNKSSPVRSSRRGRRR